MSNSETSWTVALQAPLSMEFSRLEYWSGCPFPSPGDLPKDQTWVFCAISRFFTVWSTRKHSLKFMSRCTVFVGGGWGWSWRESAVSVKARWSNYRLFRQNRVSFSKHCWNVKSIGKEDSSECRGSMFSTSLGSSKFPHSTFQDTFPVQSMSLLTLHTL